MIKVLQVLVFHFTMPFSGRIQRRWLNIYNEAFFAEIPNGVKLLTIFARKAPSQTFDWVENRFLAKGFK